MHYNRHIVLGCQTFKAFTKGYGCIFYLFKNCGVSLQNGKCCKTRGYGNWVTTQCTGLVNRTSWCNLVHNLTSAAKYSKRHATANDFTKASKVWFDIITFLCTAATSAEATHNFIKDQQCTVSLSHFAQGFKEAWFWRHTAHVTRYRFYDDSRNSIANLVE
ncbi:MAG: hypothetical protein Q620_VSAC01304G0030 [Veillonella sp. DORA_A_3_16_22]|nr:MAG: hypothetical protein Q620_VSAC01304G0030 [Veillonella sp. DORA_A_3_16_22]